MTCYRQCKVDRELLYYCFPGLTPISVDNPSITSSVSVGSENPFFLPPERPRQKQKSPPTIAITLPMPTSTKPAILLKLTYDSKPSGSSGYKKQAETVIPNGTRRRIKN